MGNLKGGDLSTKSDNNNVIATKRDLLIAILPPIFLICFFILINISILTSVNLSADNLPDGAVPQNVLMYNNDLYRVDTVQTNIENYATY